MKKILAVTLDTAAPTVLAFSPTDDAMGVAIGSNIVLTFNEAIAKGPGSIALKTAAGVTVATYVVATSTNLSVAGNLLTLNPTSDLIYMTGYRVEIGVGSIKDLSGNAYAGTSTYNFSTAVDSTAPARLTSASLTNLSTQVFWPTNQHVYEFVATPSGISWTDALAAASTKSLGGVQGHLVTITSAAEDKFVFGAFGGRVRSADAILLGASDQDTEGTWRWMAGPEIGQPLAYSNWGGSEPNDTGSGSPQDWLIYFPQAYKLTGKWADAWISSNPSNGELNGGYVVEYSGLTTTPDTTAPTVSTFSPADEATGIAIGSDIVLSFSEAIAKGTGSVTLKTVAGVVVATYGAASSANLSISGSTLTINPTADLGYSTAYSVEFAAGSIKDIAGNNYAGTTNYNFTTAAFVNRAPTGGVTITGETIQGRTLSAANTLTDADGLGAISYQWKSAGVNIGGATGSTFVLTNAQVGKAITVAASFVDGRGAAESISSAASAAVRAAPSLDLPSVLGLGWALVARMADESASGGMFDGNSNLGAAYSFGTFSNNPDDPLDFFRPFPFVASEILFISGDGLYWGRTNYATLLGVISAKKGVFEPNIKWTGSTDGVSESVLIGNVLSRQYPEYSEDPWLSLSGGHYDGISNQLIIWGESDLRGDQSALKNSHGGINLYIRSNNAPTGGVTIAGIAVQGQTLSASSTLEDVDGMGAISYQWNAAGTSIGGAVGSTLVLAEAQVGKSITVTASYTDGHSTLESRTSSATTAVTKPSVPAAYAIKSGSASFNEGETATFILTTTNVAVGTSVPYSLSGVSAADITGGLLSGTATVNAGGTATIAVLLAADLLTEGAETLTVTAGGASASTTVNDTSRTPATNNQAPTGSVTITGAATQGQTLALTNTLADADGLGAISHQWRAAGSNIAGGTASSLVLTETQVGKAITVVASYTDGRGTVESMASSATAAVANVNDLPTGAVSINGTVAKGQTLAASNTLVDADGLGAVSYQWQAAGVAIGTGNTLLLADAQVGNSITVTASYTDGHGKAEFVTSSASAAVASANSATADSLTIIGVATQGQTLTAILTLANVDIDGVISYQWLAAGSKLSGAIGNTLVLTEALVGQAITAMASYTVALAIPVIPPGEAVGITPSSSDHAGENDPVPPGIRTPTPVSRNSGQTAAVVNLNDAPTGSVTISGGATQGQTLTAANTLADADGLGAIGYQWHADGLPIFGATANTLLLGAAQAGKAISVLAGYVDGHGTAEAVASLAVQVATAGMAIELQAYSWKTHTLLSAVALGDGSRSGSTDALGAVKLADANGAALTASLSPAAATSQAVNLQDAIAILKMIVGLDVNGAGKALSPYQAYAADLDGNGKVELSDAISVLKHVVGLPSPDPLWLFFNQADASVPAKANLNPGAVPALTATPAANGATHVGLVGVLRGDVDGSYGGGGSQALDLAYFQRLGADTGLNLTQFGVYGP